MQENATPAKQPILFSRLRFCAGGCFCRRGRLSRRSFRASESFKKGNLSHPRFDPRLQKVFLFILLLQRRPDCRPSRPARFDACAEGRFFMLFGSADCHPVATGAASERGNVGKVFVKRLQREPGAASRCHGLGAASSCCMSVYVEG